jgi:hypothetical protein
MAKLYSQPLQHDQPLFVRIPFTSGGHSWEAEDHFPWREMLVSSDRVAILYREGYLIHNGELAGQMKVGDGLEAAGIEALHAIVDEYNKRIKAVVKHQTELERRKAKKSTLRSKQMGLIRNWRNNHLDWLEKAEELQKA